MPVIESENTKFDISTPVAIVGAGAAGLVAALSLADAGIMTIVLERDKVPSGSTALSSGMIPGSGTQLQRENGIIDSAELLSADISEKARGQVDHDLVKVISSTSGPTVDWLINDHGIDLTLVDGFLYPGHSRLRMHAPPSRQGADLMSNLLAATTNPNIDIITEAHVTTIFKREDRITGLKFTRPDGSIEILGCNVIILACNGYGGNPHMIKEYIPEMSEAVYFGHRGNQGDAIDWGIQLGAQIRDLGAFQGHGSVAHPHGILITWALMTEGGILVNSGGKRFTNEHEGYSEQAKRVLAQKDNTAWVIYDYRLHKLGLEFGEYKEANKAGAIKSSSTIEELSKNLKLPSKELGKTIEICDGNQIDPFGRDFTTKPALTPPYYGIKVTGALFHTQGGLAVNNDGQVLKSNGQPFPNLLASGGAAAGISGPADWGYLSGNGLLSAVSLGRITGLSAIRIFQEI